MVDGESRKRRWSSEARRIWYGKQRQKRFARRMGFNCTKTSK